MRTTILLLFFPVFLFSQTAFEKGKTFYHTSEFDSALVYFSQSVENCKDSCNDTTLALCKIYVGKTWHILEKYEKALPEFNEAAALMEGKGNFNGKAFAMISLAEMYRRAYKLEKAEIIMEEVLAMHAKQQLRKNMEAYMYNRYAAILNETRPESDKVFDYTNKVLEIANQIGDLDLKASSLNELGFYEEKRKNYDLAIGYYMEAYNIQKSQNDRIYIAQIATNLARASYLNNKLAASEQYLKEGQAIVENTDWYDTKAVLYESYTKLLYEQKRFKESKDMMEKFLEAKTAKIQLQYSKDLVETESKYELNKKSAQIKFEEQKSALAELEATKKTLQRNYIGIGTIILTFFLVLLFLSYRKIKKTNASLSIAIGNRELLLKEVNHRVKNNLQVISSLLDLQAEHTEDENAKRNLIESKNRINSIAQVHELMYAQDNMINLDMMEYITLLANEVKNSLWKEVSSDLKITCNNIELQITEAIPIGIALNELLTNSYKHARPSNNILEISVSLTRNDNTICMIYHDNGQNANSFSEGKKGIGTTVINGMVRQLHATSETILTDGFLFIITFQPQKNGEDFDS